MPSFSLAAVAATVLSMLALAPAAASARSASRGCKVAINVAPRLIEAGEAVVVFGRLRCPGQPARLAADRSVRLMQHVTGVPGFHFARATSTDGRGFYELIDPTVEFNSSFYVGALGAVSDTRSVSVRAHVSLAGPPDGSQILTGAAHAVTFTGTVSPQDVGARVVLQRQNAAGGDEWRRIDSGTVGAMGSYSITHTFVVPGDANIRALVRSQRRNAASPSQVLTYEISQAQNPQLTIEGSPDPIVFAQRVAIGGTLAGMPDTVVTLLAHVAGQPFVPVAASKTDASGNYVMPAQSPVSSTFYEVNGGGRASAVLYEGVRDLLTAQVSANTIAAGAGLTFSGAVAPDHSGDIVYLERRDARSGEFHVVQVALIGPGSTYSLVHTVYEPGVKVFRVSIPGGPFNEGAASAPFSVTVTRAPATALAPEAPANSSQPSQGEG
jgi:hypothetical protein